MRRRAHSCTGSQIIKLYNNSIDLLVHTVARFDKVLMIRSDVLNGTRKLNPLRNLESPIPQSINPRTVGYDRVTLKGKDVVNKDIELS